MSDESPVTESEVKNALEGLTVEQAEPIIAEMTLPELDKVQAAEEAGQNRKGVFEAVAKRRAALEPEDDAASTGDSTEDAPVGNTPATTATTPEEDEEAAKVSENATGGSGDSSFPGNHPDDGLPAGKTDYEREQEELVAANASESPLDPQALPEEPTDDPRELSRRSLLAQARALGNDDLTDDASEEEIEDWFASFRPDYPEGPVEEVMPVIRQGDWVVLGKAKGVPDHLINQDAVVVTANVHHAQGGDHISPLGYEFQYPSDEFLVKVRNTGETLSVTRAAVVKHGTHVSELGFRP